MSSASTASTVDTSSSGGLTVEEIRSLLESIDPYLPEAEVKTEIDIFGSTSMDSLAHGWVNGFRKFHPEAKVVISAEGSETVFKRLAENPTSIGMLSRPVTEDDLETLRGQGLTHPVAIQVAREALGVFVHESNPLETITYPQLVLLFCGDDAVDTVTWETVGVDGEFGKQEVQVIGRNKSSGTRQFTERYLFHSRPLRGDGRYMDSNSEVLQAVGDSPQAIAIADFTCTTPSVRRLKLRDKTTVVEGSEHEILLGRYPITRPLTLVFDLQPDDAKGIANLEFAHYALARVGQMQAILSGFYPFDPPTLRAERAKLDEAPVPIEPRSASAKTPPATKPQQRRAIRK